MPNATERRIRSTAVWLLVTAGLLLIVFGSGSWNASSEAAGAMPDEDLIVLDGGVSPGWQDWSWAEHKLADQSTLSGGKAAASFVPDAWKGVYLHHDAFPTHGYVALAFFVSGGKASGQKVNVCVVDTDRKFGKNVPITTGLASRTVKAGFQLCVIPLTALGAADSTITGICFTDGAGVRQPPVYLSDIRLTALHRRPAPSAIVLSVDPTKRLGAINPYIYGMAQPGPEHYRELHVPVWRWGGNPATRYNWVRGNCWNAARDWEFRNGNYAHTSEADRQPSGAADAAVATGKASGAAALITIPTMGWVARNDDNGTRSTGVPNTSGPPVSAGVEAIAGYDPLLNRTQVSVRSVIRKGAPFADPPDTTADVVYQDEWVYHLTQRFGKAAAGGVRFYAMDNEPDLWDSTHTDMHPARADYDEVLNRFLTAADAVKAVDPTAQITGPASWGWTGYFFSARDRGDDNFRTHADRMAHGDMPFLAWFLQKVAAHDANVGHRTLDYLDVHYYPQADGVYGGDASKNGVRLRSTAALWDPSYIDESWIGTPVQLLPRLRNWINHYYPGTKIALNEWNWGAENSLNGGLAVAEALGILGRERVDMACYWAVPPPYSPAFFAYKMYRNADGAFGGFGDIAISAASNSPKDVSCFGSVDSKSGRPVIMVINKMAQSGVSATLVLPASSGVKSASVFQYGGPDTKSVHHLSDITFRGGRAAVSLPAYSITLFRCR